MELGAVTVMVLGQAWQGAPEAAPQPTSHARLLPCSRVSPRCLSNLGTQGLSLSYCGVFASMHLLQKPCTRVGQGQAVVPVS